MGVELFVTGAGLVVNEIAPRVHNSGHWTQNGCAVDQFEQHVRAVAGWPLGDGSRHADVTMENLIGDDIARVPALAREPGAGAASLRQGRGAAGPQDGPCQPHHPRNFRLTCPAGSDRIAAATRSRVRTYIAPQRWISCCCRCFGAAVPAARAGRPVLLVLVQRRAPGEVAGQDREGQQRPPGTVA